MVKDAELSRVFRAIARVVRDYASAQGWRPEDYRAYADFNPEWGYVNIVLAVRDLGARDQHAVWEDVKTFLDARLGGLLAATPSFNLGIRTFDQIGRGGVYAVTDDYTDLDEYAVAVPSGLSHE